MNHDILVGCFLILMMAYTIISPPWRKQPINGWNLLITHCWYATNSLFIMSQHAPQKSNFRFAMTTSIQPKTTPAPPRGQLLLRIKLRNEGGRGWLWKWGTSYTTCGWNFHRRLGGRTTLFYPEIWNHIFFSKTWGNLFGSLFAAQDAWQKEPFWWF